MLNSGDTLRGLAAQTMGGPKAPRFTAAGFSPAQPAFLTDNNSQPIANLTGSWTVRQSGLYRFAMWGAGASGYNPTPTGGGSGAFFLGDRNLLAGQSVSFQVGGCASNSNVDGGDTWALLPSGEKITAGGGKILGGVAAGGAVSYAGSSGQSADIALSGSIAGAAGQGPDGGASPGASTVNGGSAPGAGGHQGGATGVGQCGGFPGAGGSGNWPSQGGAGNLIVYRVA